MCYAIPGKVIEIKDKTAVVDYFGEKRKAVNEIHDLKIGDYIYAQGGFVIQAIPENEALEVLALWKDAFFELQKIDQRLSRLEGEKRGVPKKLTLILDKAAEDRLLKDSELLYLLNLEKEEELNLLYKTANFLRQKHLKNSCCVHGIIEFSNFCTQGCLYCGISTHNRDLTRYRMTKKEIIDTAYQAIEKDGFKALVLQSGEDKAFSIKDLCEIVSEIKKRSAVLIFISFGEVGIPGLQKLYDAGARGVLLRFETSNQKLYQKLHPGRKLDSRLEHLRAAYKMGYLIITGGLIGLPGQTREDLLADILLTKSLRAEMYTFGPFLPHPETPLARRGGLAKSLPPENKEVLKVLAATRLADAKNAKIVVTTGFETLDPCARELGLMAGANSVMINVTPYKYKGNYAIYPARAHVDESIEKQIEDTFALLKRLGRAPTDLGVGE